MTGPTPDHLTTLQLRELAVQLTDGLAQAALAGDGGITVSAPALASMLGLPKAEAGMREDPELMADRLQAISAAIDLTVPHHAPAPKVET